MTKRTLKRTRSSINRHNRRVRQKNEIFEKMTKAEKRAQLARDVIAQVAARKLVAMSGTWLSRVEDGAQRQPLLRRTLVAGGEIDDALQMNKLLPQIEQCNACAVGALLYCTVMRANALTVGEIRQHGETADMIITEFEKIKVYLGGYFSDNQLNMMEAAFEKRHSPGDQTKSVTRAGCMFLARTHTAEYGWEWIDRDNADDETRLVVIMQNVADNGGTFKPVRYHG